MALNFKVEAYAGRSYFQVRNGLAETYEQAQEIARHYRGARIMKRTKDLLGWVKVANPSDLSSAYLHSSPIDHSQ